MGQCGPTARQSLLAYVMRHVIEGICTTTKSFKPDIKHLLLTWGDTNIKHLKDWCKKVIFRVKLPALESADTRQTLDWRWEWPWMSINYVKLQVALPLNTRTFITNTPLKERQTLASTNESAGEKHVLWSCDTPSPEARGLRELSFAWLSYSKSLSSLRAGPGAPWRAGNKQF